MKEIGDKIKLVVMGFIYITMVLDTKVTGSMIISMDMVFKLGLTIVNTKECIIKEKNMDKENMFGKMEVIIKEIGRIIKLQDMVFTFGLMEENTKVTG